MDILKRSRLALSGVPAWLKVRIMGKEALYLQVDELPVEFWPNEVCNKKQFEVYKAIVDYKDQNGYAPTYAELVTLTGRAIATVQKRIKELEALGLIEYHGSHAITVRGEIYMPPLPVRYIADNPEKIQEKA